MMGSDTNDDGDGGETGNDLDPTDVESAGELLERIESGEIDENELPENIDKETIISFLETAEQGKLPGGLGDDIALRVVRSLFE